ncbi:hypothetical protein BJV78DRAFT_1364118 [Lactifluus subvellereus]|nr:hypothetical protein BJV78DRAFT_1364118 [Lactifluus subvellereus]
MAQNEVINVTVNSRAGGPRSTPFNNVTSPFSCLLLSLSLLSSSTAAARALGHELCGEAHLSTIPKATSLSSPAPPRCRAHRYRNPCIYEVSTVVPLLTSPMRAIQETWGLQLDEMSRHEEDTMLLG